MEEEWQAGLAVEPYREGLVLKITCDDCKHFVRDRINPPAGIGTCGHPKRKEQVGFYPMEKHLCRAHEPITPPKETP